MSSENNIRNARNLWRGVQVILLGRIGWDINWPKGGWQAYLPAHWAVFWMAILQGGPGCHILPAIDAPERAVY